MTSRLRKYLRLPSGIALLFGLGAISAGGSGAQAKSVDPQGGTAQPVAGGMIARAKEGKIYLCEGGRESELRLGATPEREHLLRLLEPHGAGGVRLENGPRLIMAGGGAGGFSLRDLAKPFTDNSTPPKTNTRQPATTSPSPKQGSGPRDSRPSSDKKG